MDDQNFDQKTALDWIKTVEVPGATPSDGRFSKLKTWVDDVSPREILEIGAGQGRCSDRIDLSGRKYTGVDPSSYLVERAKAVYPQEDRIFLVGNAYDLPLKNTAFDAVFSMLVWHLLGDPR